MPRHIIMDTQRLFLLSANRHQSRVDLVFLVTLLLLTCPVVGRAQNAVAQLTAVPVANLYSTPSREADVVSQSVFGQELLVLQEKEDWIQVRTPDQYVGWTPRESALPPVSSQRLAQVSSIFANVYRETDVTAHQPLLTLPFEAKIHLIDEDGHWLKLRLPDGQDGWIQRGDVAVDTRALSISESIELAKRFLGFPYLWGGSSSFGYDCSGFTQMLVRSRGVVMPRDADLQAAWSGVVPVDRRHLQSGDLLFFGDSVDKITHTGMYIGKGKFIHSTTHDHPVVQISRLKDKPWTMLLVASRRVKKP